ncbi:hypothetical protein OF83DRAFT_1069434 [Amylostereum chailletii]|nr:hypothetical protein OF83DRAFT_1069434 [Amylostereum chailletii]
MSPVCGIVEVADGQTPTQDAKKFPPEPPSNAEIETIIRKYYDNILPENVLEEGCAVCGSLTLSKNMKSLKKYTDIINILEDSTDLVARQGQHSERELVQSIEGPILASGCSKVCQPCEKKLDKGKIHSLALANGNWIGKVPPELQDLRYAEKMMISRVCHNYCVVKVEKSGMHKMRANAIMFSVPMPKVFNVLPPIAEELDKVLAYIYIGPSKPTDIDNKRTPLFVCRNKVREALEWLKLNHRGYSDLTISYDNLNAYPKDSPPVMIDYRLPPKHKDSENQPVNLAKEEEGVDNGDCPFVVHTLTGSQLGNKTTKQLKALAVKHLTDGHSALGIGHEAVPESLY